MYSIVQHEAIDTVKDIGNDLMISGAAASVSCRLTVRIACTQKNKKWKLPPEWKPG